jgi:hypothetical protein
VFSLAAASIVTTWAAVRLLRAGGGHGHVLFVGLNLFQSAVTNWCPMRAFLRRRGLRTADDTCRPSARG